MFTSGCCIIPTYHKTKKTNLYMHHVNGKSDDLRAGSSNGHFLCGSAVGGSHTYASPLGFKPTVQTIKQDKSTQLNV